MGRKSLSQVLHEVSSDLTVIPGRVHPHGRRKKVVKLDAISRIEMPVYIPHRMTEEDWEKAGGIKCPRCHNDTVRLVPYGMMGKRRACPDCRERRRKLMEYKARIMPYKKASARYSYSKFRRR